MIDSDKQRRWWFANHPEYSSSSTTHGEDDHIQEYNSDKPTPREVDSWVDEALKYEQDWFCIGFLKETKRWFGTAGETPETYAELGLPYPKKNDASPPKKEEDKSEPESTMWDAFLEGLRRTWDGQPVFDIGFGLAQSSRKLDMNMKAKGLRKPPGYAAHHIVAAGDSRFPSAVRAREILKECGIGINEAVNGVYLPHKIRVNSAAYHRVLHAGRYYDKVAMMLEGTKTREVAIKILEKIRLGLSNDTFFP